MSGPVTVEKLLRESKRGFERVRREISNSSGPQKMLITEAPPIKLLLSDDRMAKPVAELVAVSMSSFLEPGAEERTCFGCLKPWSANRSIATVVIIEWLNLSKKSQERAMFSGMCPDCAGDQDKLLNAIKRDFGDLQVQTIHDAGTA